MATISISVEGASGTTWERFAIVTELMEASSMHRLFVSDHLVGPFPPDFPNIEAMMSLAYVANRTSRVGFGTQVAPLTLRDPVLLLRQAAALHSLSGGAWYWALARDGTNANTGCSGIHSAPHAIGLDDWTKR